MTIPRGRSLLILVLAVVLLALTAGSALGKAHVPADDVQVSHKGRVAKTVDAPALNGHMRHGDLQLPACDFNNVFVDGTDTSNVLATSFAGVLYTTGFVPRADAGGITPACPPGTF